MGEGEVDKSARLQRGLWMLRVAVVPWLGLVLGPMFLGLRSLLEPQALPDLYFGLLLPAVALHLGAMSLCKQRPGLMAVAVWGAFLFLLTVVSGWDALDDVSYVGWRPVVWVGLLALSQLAIVVAAGRAWFLAPSADGAVVYLGALAGATAPFLIWGFVMTPMHGWSGHRHSGNESLAIGDIRTMISAQAIYQVSNGGFYDVPECLVSPQRCIPAYPANAPTFIDSQLGQTTVVRQGYRRTFYPGPAAEPSAIREMKASPTSITSYAYIAVPRSPGRTGVRAFCGDGTGRICYTTDGSVPRIDQGLCAASSCTALQ